MCIRDSIVALLKESDIFCLPSFSEGFSTSILEASACGCYIVTTARGGAKELLINEDYGCIIPNNQEDVLYKALRDVIADPDKAPDDFEKIDFIHGYGLKNVKDSAEACGGFCVINHENDIYSATVIIPVLNP